jgi:hypothetical protein
MQPDESATCAESTAVLDGFASSRALGQSFPLVVHVAKICRAASKSADPAGNAATIGAYKRPMRDTWSAWSASIPSSDALLPFVVDASRTCVIRA